MLLGPPSATPTLLGTTPGGGANGDGMIFTLSLNSFNTIFNDIHDFSGSNDGASPDAGLALDIGDHVDSVWSLDTTLNISDASQIPYIGFNVSIDNTVEVYVNGNYAYSTLQNGQNPWQSGISLQNYLQHGPNDIRVLINNGGDNDNNDYFTMVVTNAAENYFYTPTTPTGVNAGPGNAEVTLSWAPVSGATGYNIYRSTASGGPYSLLGTTPTTTQTNYTDISLANGTAYYYEVAAVDANNSAGPIVGPSSSPVGPVTPGSGLQAPLNVVAMAGVNQMYNWVSLRWNSSSGASGYNVYRSTASGGPYSLLGTTPTTTQTAYTDAIGHGGNYYYEVSAVDANNVEGPLSSYVGLIQPGGEPQTPEIAGKPRAVFAGNHFQVALRWSPSKGAASYNVYRSYMLLANTTATNDTDTPVASGTTNYYEVSAVFNGFESLYSSQVSVIVPPAAPTGLSAVPGNAEVTLSWAPASGATGYNVYYSTASAGPYTLIGAAPTTTQTTYTDSPLANGTAYYFEVSALDSNNVEGPASSPVGPVTPSP